MASLVAVHSQLATLFLGSKAWQELLGVGTEPFIHDREKKKKPGSHGVLKGHFLNDLKTSHGLHSLKLPPPPSREYLKSKL